MAETYSYDAVGNRLTSLGVSPYTYNSSNELTSKPGVTYAYDPNGNLTSKTEPNGATSYTWDFENRLTSITFPNGTSFHFRYDPFGRRIQSDAVARSFVYDGDNLVEELDSSGKAVARYAEGLGIDEPLEIFQSGAASYYEADGLGSITSLTDPSGSPVASYTYDSFGNVTASTSTVGNRLLYTGRENVPKAGLYYFRARYYDPGVGRFISEDLFDGAPSRYAYVVNSPANLIDPWGLQGILGPNPFPPLSGRDLSLLKGTLELAKKAACNKVCDGALQADGIKSLAALVKQMAANVNVFDGRTSTYPVANGTVAGFLAQGSAGAMVPFPVQLTFLGDYFFNPTKMDFPSQQRALILLHESVHQFGGKQDANFGGSRKLTDRLAEKCFPALKALHLLGNLTE